MPAHLNQPSQLEIAHVLFLDLVEYSLLPMAEQTRQLEQLQALLRGTAGFRRAEQGGELIRLPTGDGMALVFFRDPEAPVHCALELAGALCGRPQIKLRMGVHTGPVYRIEDINANMNVSGGGINIAERVVECGDAGHILLSSTAAELLEQLGDWSASLHDLGECEVKHGVRLHLFNLYTDDLGNPAVPQRLLGQPGASHHPSTGVTSPRSQSSLTASTAPPPAGTALQVQRIALLYKRHTQPDERVLQFLEEQLSARGCSLFIDRHLPVGVEWAQAIEREIRAADAVIPLLSAASVDSEMLKYEIQIAHEAAQHHGRPRLLPVRVSYTQPLEDPLAAILEPLQYAFWEGPQDDERLIDALLDALQRAPAPPPVGPVKLEPVGGAVPLESPFYVVRSTDSEFHTAVARQDSIVLVKGARQMGKTSLLARGVQRAREAGARVVLTDFQKLNAAHLESAETLFLALADAIADQLSLDVFPDQVWHSRRGPSVNFERYMRREVLEKLDVPLVWGMDEVDRLFSCDFSTEVFGLFRAWHNERALDPAGPWSRLTLAIAYAREAHMFITDMNQSPFNVGTRLTLEDFTFEQVADLNRRSGSPLRDEAELARFYRLVGGHPYLVRRGLLEMASRGLLIGDLEAQADRDEGIYGDHLRRLLVALSQNEELCDAMRGVLRRRPCPSADSFYRLRSAGLVAGDSAHVARPRCQLYTAYLNRHLP